MPKRAATLDRILTRSLENEAGCWVYQGSLHTGYCYVYIEGRAHYGHRVTYEFFVTDIPEGLELDHLCRNRACVNPWHLDPVTHRVNCLRGPSRQMQIARSTTCGQGHEFTETNTTWVRGSRDGKRRRCKTCSLRYVHRSRGKAV